MKVRQKIGQGFKSLIDFRRWMGWGQIKGSAKDLKNLAQTMMSPEEAERKETFEQAARRLHLDDEAIKKRASRHLSLAAFFAILAVALFSYSIFLLITHRYEGAVLGIFVCFVPLSLGFREHFYYFQMKKRRLGCTFQDWVDFVLGRGEK